MRLKYEPIVSLEKRRERFDTWIPRELPPRDELGAGEREELTRRIDRLFLQVD